MIKRNLHFTYITARYGDWLTNASPKLSSAFTALLSSSLSRSSSFIGISTAFTLAAIDAEEDVDGLLPTEQKDAPSATEFSKSQRIPEEWMR